MQELGVLKAIKACLSALKASESLKESEKSFEYTKPKIKFSKPRREKIIEEFNKSRCKFSKSKINEIRRNLSEIENIKNLSARKIKEIEKYLFKLDKNHSKPKRYYDYDYDTEYKGRRDVKDLFDLSVDEDYCKPILTNGAFNNYIQYESKRNKDKALTNN